jgi:branched-chain amino acid transport system substrate-binding protein
MARFMFLVVRLAFVFAWAIITTLAMADGPPLARKPAVDFRERATPYAGPGRDAPGPARVSEVLIGYFGPSDSDHPEHGDAWVAAELAVTEANREGGLDGVPFRLVPAWSDTPWSAGAALLAKLVYRDRVWAIVGGPDGPTTHLAEQIVAKARLPLVSAIAGDRTANAANVPWIVSLLPADHLQARALASHLNASGACAPGTLAIVSSNDHDARMFVTEFDRALKARSLAPTSRFVVGSNASDVDELGRQVARSGVGTVVIAAGPTSSASLVGSVRRGGFSGAVLGTVAMGHRAFLKKAGPAAEGVVFPLVYGPANEDTAFERAFRSRAGHPPDYSAAYTYDGVRLLIEATRKAGLNRARIGDALRDPAPFQGETGAFAFDSMGGGVREVRLGVVRGGRVARLDGETAPPGSLAPSRGGR